MDGWHFDPLSALVGAAAAFLLIGLVRLLRISFAQMRERAKETTRQVVGRATASAEQRYRQRIAAWASEHHVLSPLASLESVFVPPLLIPPPLPPDPAATHPTNRRPIPPETLLSGHSRVIIVGGLASGRTTLLTHLALLHANPASEGPSETPHRLPLYVALPSLDWTVSEEETKALTAAERLVQAAVETVNGSSSHAAALHRNLSAGTALVLADGWDELPPEHRERAAAWLGRLAEDLPGNLWVVAAGLEGFAPLVDAGFTPLRLAPWQPSQVETLFRRWQQAVAPEEEGPSPRPTSILEALRTGATPLELSLRSWLALLGEPSSLSPGEVFLKGMDRLLGPEEVTEEEVWLPTAVRVALGRLALTLQQEGRPTASRKEIEEALETALPPEGERPARARERAWEVLTGARGVLQPRGQDSFGFTHPLWRAFLAARQMLALPAEAMLDHLEDPAWGPVVDFYAEWGPMEPLIEAWFAQPDDLWHTRLRRAARWAARAPADARWRNGVMALLARTLLKPDLPLPIRQQIADALVQTGDPGVTFFLSQAVRHSLAEVRVVAVKTLGLMAREADLSTFEEALADPDTRVREAAVAALGTVGDRAAVHQLARLLVEAEQEMRIEAARALARCGEEGWEVLREALQHEDLLTRRAAVYGLAEVTQPWVEPQLTDVARDDPEWIVRSAAETVLEAKEKRPHPVQPPLEVSEMGWLIAWAAEQGEVVGRGDAAFAVLLRAIEEGTPEVRKAAAVALGLAGRPEHVPVLRRAMKEENPEIAAAALEALEELCHRHGITVQ